MLTCPLWPGKNDPIVYVVSCRGPPGLRDSERGSGQVEAYIRLHGMSMAAPKSDHDRLVQH